MITFSNHPVIWCLVAFIFLFFLVTWCMVGIMAYRHAPMLEELDLPPSAGLRPEDSERPALPAGYMESMRTRELRAAFVARHATPEEIQAAKNAKAIRALMQNVGRN